MNIPVSPVSCRVHPTLDHNLDPKQSDKIYSVQPPGLSTVCTELRDLAEFHNSIPADLPVNTSLGG